jgi:hypothetical protein
MQLHKASVIGTDTNIFLFIIRHLEELLYL